MSFNKLQLGMVALLLASLTGLEAGCDGFIGGSDEVEVPVSIFDDEDYGIDDQTGEDGGRSLAFYYGPMKQMVGESILYSIAAITGHDFGAWEYTCPDPGTGIFTDAGNGDGTYYRHCRLLGGCMEHRIPLARTSFVGTAYVLELEKAVTLACSDREAFGMFPGEQAPQVSTQVIEIINEQYKKAFGSDPSIEDVEQSVAYFEGHIQDPEFDDVTPLESAGRGHCRALLGSNRFLFY
jgi:hypothetical protein